MNQNKSFEFLLEKLNKFLFTMCGLSFTFTVNNYFKGDNLRL